MARFNDETFTEKTIDLDGNHYEGCTFTKCTLRFSGGTGPTMIGNTITDCRWEFGGQAANTIAFLTRLSQGGARELVDATLENIRAGRLPDESSPILLN